MALDMKAVVGFGVRYFGLYGIACKLCIQTAVWCTGIGDYRAPECPIDRKPQN